MNDEIYSSNNEEGKSKRRDFLGILLSGGFFAWLIALLYPVFKYLEPPPVEEAKVTSVKIGTVEDMAKDTGKIIKFGNRPVIVIRKKNGDYVALSAVCTHLDCIVQYRKDYGQIYCACHNGRYDLNGKNISGPPPAPLTPYAVKIVKDEVIVHQNEA